MKPTQPSKPTAKQSKAAVNQLKKHIKDEGIPLKDLILMGEAANSVIQDKSQWPEFAEFIGADPASQPDFQLLAQYVTYGKAAEELRMEQGDGPVSEPVAP